MESKPYWANRTKRMFGWLLLELALIVSYFYLVTRLHTILDWMVLLFMFLVAAGFSNSWINQLLTNWWNSPEGQKRLEELHRR